MLCLVGCIRYSALCAFVMLCYRHHSSSKRKTRMNWTLCIYVSMCVIWMGKNFISSQKNENNNNKNLWAIVIMMENSLGDYKNFLVFAWQCLFGWILNEICEFGFIKEKTLHKCLSACLSNIWCWHFLVCLFLEIIIKYWIW